MTIGRVVPRDDLDARGILTTAALALGLEVEQRPGAVVVRGLALLRRWWYEAGVRHGLLYMVATEEGEA